MYDVVSMGVQACTLLCRCAEKCATQEFMHMRACTYVPCRPQQACVDVRVCSSICGWAGQCLNNRLVDECTGQWKYGHVSGTNNVPAFVHVLTHVIQLSLCAAALYVFMCPSVVTRILA